MKKAWVAVLSPVPRAEAFALPIAARTSNAEAHADMYNSPTGVRLMNETHTSDRCIHIHKASTEALSLDGN